MKESARRLTGTEGPIAASANPRGSGRSGKRWFRWLLAVFGLTVMLLVMAIGAVFWLFRASLPVLDGQITVEGTPTNVIIERDELGVPTITATNRQGVVYGLGFVHGQDRFFQMDLRRRAAAGELAALLGPELVDQDRWQRIRTSREVARKAFERLKPAERELVESYTRGVNAGVENARVRPPEYLVLRTRPAPWSPEDALLVLLAMAFDITPGPNENVDSLMRREIGKVAFEFFYPEGTQWDAALDGSILGETTIPGPEVIDFRKGWKMGEPPDRWKRFANQAAERLELVSPTPRQSITDLESDTIQPGSNGWAIDGKFTRTGSAMVAGDMHLDYSMPSVFYRARLKWKEGGQPRDLIVVTLPGMPGGAAGSNGSVAWVATAAVMDIVDLVAIEVDPNQTNRYRVPEGWAEFELRKERIEVRGSDPVEFTLRTTIWGPVDERTRDGTPFRHQGYPVAVQYVFHRPDALDFRFFDLMIAKSTDEAIEIAVEAGCPVVNLMVGDKRGHVGWTVAGPLPQRTGRDRREMAFSRAGSARWNGLLAAKDHPRVGSPEVPQIFSGNQRKLGSGIYSNLFDSDPMSGARAMQIRDALAGLTNATEREMLAIQLDDRALFLKPWGELLENTLRAAISNSSPKDYDDVLEHLTKWSGRASADEVGYRVLRAFRRRTIDYLTEPLTHKASELTGQPMGPPRFGFERPVWALIGQRPAHLLNPRFANYDDLFARAAEDVIEHLRGLNNGDISRATWGRAVNRPIRHLFSRVAPFLSRSLDASTIGCSGGNDMPRVHGFGGGATERIVVSPGQESGGIFHMPGGQSGHFLSPFYRAGHEAWVRGEATPLLPGTTKHVLKLLPP